MKNYATIVEFKRFKKVTYYSLQFDDEESEAEKFFSKALEWKHISDYVTNLVDWFVEIGNERGAQIDFFRPEDRAVALPPNRNIPGTKKNDIRLYCHWVSEQIVIIYNGGIKTNIDPIKCPNVSPYFLLSNKASKQLKEIGIEHSGQLITNLDELILEL